ncbi:MAG: polysaccharide deacetylase family protein [Anaerolineales bacterium]|nr:polysaccharide deacetylase family protein [Anaerolineales bacterium]
MFLFRKKRAAFAAGLRLEIILYHFVSERRNGFTLSGHTVTVEEFRRQLEYLAARYRIVRLNEIAALGGTAAGPAQPCAAVCFDDGYRCVLEEAYPVLQAMRIPATMFVNPLVLGNRDLLWRDKIRYLMQAGLEAEFTEFLRTRGGPYRFGMLKELGFYKWSKNPKAIRTMRIQQDTDEFFARKGFDPASIAAENELFMEEADVAPREFLDFGNHTWSHPLLTLLSAAVQREEIVRCHEYLAARGIAAAGLALPFSPFNRRTIAVCRELGYAWILTVFEKSNLLPPAIKDRPLVLHRWMASKDAAGLAARLEADADG